MKDWRSPIAGHFLRRTGSVWRITLNLNGKLHLENYETGETDKLRLSDFHEGCFASTIEMLEHPRLDIPEERRALSEIPVSALTPLSLAQVDRMRRYIEAYLDPDGFYDEYRPDLPSDERHQPDRMSAAKVVPLLLDVSSSFGPQEQKPGFTTFAGWMRMWVRYRDWKLMASLFHLRGSSDRTVIVGEMKRIIDRAIKSVWMNRSLHTKEDVCASVEHRVRDYNEQNPAKQIGVSRRQIYRYMADSIDKYDEAVARRGKAAADRLFKPKKKGPGANRIMEVVEVDHTQAKLEVTHDETGKSLGRPWITVAFCRRSRMPVGLHIHFEGGTLCAVMQCLRNTMMPKGFLRHLVPDLDYDYPCCGIPEKFFFDRGSDFDSDYVRDVSLNFDIVTRYAPGDNPEYKGAIERFLRTLHQECALKVKGATPRIKDRRDDNRPQKSEATMSFSDFYARVWFWLTMVYAKEFHEGLEGIPLDVWNESSALRAPRAPLSREISDKFLMRAVRCEPTVNGVRYLGLIWNAEGIRLIRSHPSYRRGQEILVHMDDNDLGRAFAVDPVTGEFHPLEPVLPRYMYGLSMHVHELVRRKVKQRREGTYSERALMDAKAKLRDEALLTLEMKSTQSHTRARIAKFFQVGSVAPSGDDLGSLDPRNDFFAQLPKKRQARAKTPAFEKESIDVAPPVQPHIAASAKARRSGPARRLDQ